MATSVEPQISPRFWNEPVSTLYKQEQSSLSGLTSTEAGRRLADVGPNDLARGGSSLILQTLRSFVNPQVLILLFAAVVSGEYFNASLIAVMVLISVGLPITRSAFGPGDDTGTSGRAAVLKALSRGTVG